MSLECNEMWRRTGDLQSHGSLARCPTLESTKLISRIDDDCKNDDDDCYYGTFIGLTCPFKDIFMLCFAMI